MPIRLAIVGLPRLLADVIAEAFKDDAVQVDLLPEDATYEDGDSALHEVIVVGVTDPWHNPLLTRISRAARPTVLGVRTDGRESWIYRMQPCPQRLGPATPAQIRAAVLAGRQLSV